MTSLTSFCEIACQIVQKNHEEKRIEEEQAAKAQNRKLPVCYDDDDDEEESNSLKDNIIFELPPCSAVTPSKPIDSLSIGDEHLDTIPTTKSNEFIKSCVENLVPNPSESEGENGCDVPYCFTTFSNILFDADYDFESVDEIDLFLTPDDPMPPSIEDDNDSEGDNLFLERLLHDDPIPLSNTLDFLYEVIIFLPFFTYPVTSLILLSSGSENTIFDPGITINHFYFF
nr:hypothetical protein [Tanacetum cinerariifolium]